ncbi:Tetratricopeptide repeat protein 1 protein [Pleurostoma richardsiae]|uniref:Tetratricopeptide repeat protein 1 protein n=1 Tax=Pleurostoma richardsiae TaxID=41990 RepID=A0AA38VXL4_9PEZI|nr:Tetratricopeptide repeat protein 1 protein [Pleurostoma richardsiae]
MAPVALEPEITLIPTIVVIWHIFTASFLTSTVGLGLYRSYKGLGPSQDVRARITRRKKLVPVFAVLAFISLILAGFSSATYAALSYRVWADERGIQIPTSIFPSSSNSTEVKNATQVFVTRWLTDVPIYRDAWEIVAEKSRRFWWGQQVDLSLVAWSLLLAIEGRRRRIPFLWAYLSLAHLVNLSFAQNLFYVALLLTPSPLPPAGGPSLSRLGRVRNALFPPKPPNWTPYPGLFLVVLLSAYGTLFVVPYAAGTPSFNTVLGVSKALTFAPLALQDIAPVSWGKVPEHPHKAYSAFTDLFRLISLMSMALHGKATIIGLLSNVPKPHYHRHSKLLPWDVETRSKWERTTTAFGKVLGSTSDHPVVAAVGRDVLLCGLSLGLWAAVRAIETSDILISAVPLYKGQSDSSGSDTASSDPEATGSHSSSTPESPIKAEGESTGTLRRSSRRHRPTLAAKEAGIDLALQTPRKRGRSRKIKQDPEEAEDDQTYQPTPAVKRSVAEGDVLPDEELDWESAALAWGLTALGGLGCGSAGVFGGECISR